MELASNAEVPGTCESDMGSDHTTSRADDDFGRGV